MFIGECKICWSGATSPNTESHLLIDKMLDDASSDIRKTTPYVEKRLAIVFARPYISRTCEKYADEYIENWLTKAMSAHYSCCAWVFPAVSRKIGGKKDVCPGVAVFIRSV